MFIMYISYRMIPGLASGHSGPLPAFSVLGRSFSACWPLSVGFLASLERLALKLTPSDLDLAPLDSPRDALDVAFGGHNGLICKNSDECKGFVASIDFSYDFRMFSLWFFHRRSAQLLITSSVVFALHRGRSGWLKPRKTLAGAIKIKVRRLSGF